MSFFDTLKDYFRRKPSSQRGDIPLPPMPVPSSGRWQLSDAGTSLLMQLEGFETKAYKDSAGVWTIGYGSTRIDGLPVQEGQTITQPKAAQALRSDINRFATTVAPLVTVSLTQNQIDAILIFTYNVGVGGFSKSTLLRTINAKQPVTEDMFTRWNKITKNGDLVVLPGLTSRRKKEYQLYMRG